MEEEIKILKNLIEYLQFKIDSGEHKIIYNDLMYDEKTIDCINSIENLIKAYKELKEIEQIHRQENGELRERVKELEEENQQLEAIKDEAIRRYNLESIPTSLVKEKIEELKENGYWNYLEKRDLETTIDILQELLEKRK